MIQTTYPGDNSQTTTQAPGYSFTRPDDMDFFRQAAMRAIGPAPAPAAAPTMGRSRGPRVRVTEGVRQGPSRDPRLAAGRHSFVTNVKGGPQVMGGYMPTAAGASPGNTAYGGWQVDAGPGPTHFAGLPDNSGAPAIAPGVDPAVRARLVNSGLPGAQFDPLSAIRRG